MARLEVPDTTVLIRVMRDPRTWPAFKEALEAGRIWLSSVVLAELYAGTRSREDALLLDRIVAAMERVRRILTPTTGDWIRAGRLIGRHVRVRGQIRPRDHLSDVLIVVSAARLRAAVVTSNVRHFATWAEFATAAGMDVTIVPYDVP